MSWRREPGALAATAVALAMLLPLLLGALGPDALERSGDVPVTGAAGEPLDVFIEHVVTTDEEWGQVTVRSGGSLTVAKGATLRATGITLMSSSLLTVEGGTILLKDDGATDQVALVGACTGMDLGPGSVIGMTGTHGTGEAGDTTGASVRFEVEARDYIVIEGAQVTLVGGDGGSPPEPLTAGALSGDECRGGSVTVSLRCLAGDEPMVRIEDSILDLSAGDGGDAPDGTPAGDEEGGRGGGYSSGGSVSGHVGAGGDATLDLSTTELEVDRSQLLLRGGDGGDAGEGAVSGRWAGGGGGGYSGGGGADRNGTRGQAGGPVGGDVGSGGDARATIVSSRVIQRECAMRVSRGDGGRAGDGGDIVWTLGGGSGGGGYSGGGGGSAHLAPGGQGGRVSDRVGSGGDGELTLEVDGKVEMRRCDLNVSGGMGGDAGQGGSSSALGGAGGGGYSGGGGGGEGPVGGMPGGDGHVGGAGGEVSGDVAQGGASELSLWSYDALVINTTLDSRGGDGGDGGHTGSSDYSPLTDEVGAGGGGGSYSAGGGGGSQKWPHAPGAGGVGLPVEGAVGDGGDCWLWLDSNRITISRECEIGAREGRGGSCTNNSAKGEPGGTGIGRLTASGLRLVKVPMSTPVLLSPRDGLVTERVPRFAWMDLHNSTMNGEVTGFIFQMDADPEFSAPEVQISSVGNVTYPGVMRLGENYWRVRATYSRPPGRTSPWSDPWCLTFVNEPPTIGDIPTLEIPAGKLWTVNLSRYIQDPDSEPGELSLYSKHPNLRDIWGLNLSFYFPSPRAKHQVAFTVSDPYHLVDGTFFIEVTQNNTPPRILGLGHMAPPVMVRMLEEETRSYRVVATDPDGDPLEYRVTESSWKGATVDEHGTMYLNATGFSSDVYTAVVVVTDSAGDSDSLSVTVMVGNVNKPPTVPVFTMPRNGTHYEPRQDVVLGVTVHDPDFVFGQLVNVTFISNLSGVLGTLATDGNLTWNAGVLVGGVHRITAEATDGYFTKSSWIVVEVEEEAPKLPVSDPPKETSPLPWVVAAMVAVFLVGFVGGLLRARRRRARRL